MPIDFASIAQTFQLPYQRDVSSIKDSFERLGDWLSQRLERYTALEQSTRMFPLVLFRGDALSAWIDSSQHESLTAALPPADAWRRALSDAAQALLRGLRAIPRAVEEALLIPRLLSTIDDLLRIVVASLERFSEPRAAMFDPRARRASDIFGELGLFFRAFGTSLGQVQQVTAIAGELMRPGASTAPTTPDRDLPAVLAEVGRGLTGGVLATLRLSQLLEVIMQSGGLAFRIQMLATLRRFESRIQLMRRNVLDIVYVGLQAHARRGVAVVSALNVFVMDNLRYYAKLGQVLGSGVAFGVRNYLLELSEYLRWWTDLIERVRSGIQSVLDFDLMPFLARTLGIPPFIIDLLPLPKVTVDDLLSIATGFGTVAIGATLNQWLLGVERILHAGNLVVSDEPGVLPLYKRVRALRYALNTVLTRPAPLPAEARLPSTPLASAPNVYAAFFGAGLPFADVRANLTQDLGGIFGAGSYALQRLSGAFESAAARAASLGRVDQYEAITANAISQSSAIFGAQELELRPRTADQLGGAFEQWIAHGGFELVGDGLAVYTSEMQRYWQEHGAEPPTSPHILDRRRPLGRVQMPRLVIRAAGRQVDAALISDIAAQFQSAVRDAFSRGSAQYAQAG